MALPLPAEDGELVTLARGGSDDAFAALYERYFPSIYDFLTRLMRDRQEAADIAQDTFITAFERLGSLDNPGSFRSWLFTIAHRNALNRIERSKRSVAVGDFHIGGETAELGVIDLDRAGNPERSAEAQAAASLIWEAAAGLDPRTYAVMDLHVRQGLGSAEIADVLGISRGNAYAMVSRMKKSFSQTLSTYLLVRNGSTACEALAAMVAESGGPQLTPDLRKQVDRHAKSCEICKENRRLLFIPLRLFAALAAVPAPAGLEAAIWGSAAAARGGGAGAGAPASAATTAGSSSWIGANVGSLSAAAVLVVALVVAGVSAVRNNSAGDTEVLSSGLGADATAAPGPGSTTAPPSTAPETTLGQVSPSPTSRPPVAPTSTTPAPTPTTTVPPAAPVAVADSARLAEDTSIVIDVLANDSGYAPGAAPEIVTVPAHGTARVSRSSIFYAPAANYAGPDRLAYSIRDSGGARHTAQVIITVTGVNDIPVVPGPGALTIEEDRTLTFDPLKGAVDVDGDRLTVTSFDSASANGGSIAAGSIVYRPRENWAGIDTFSYVVGDGTVDVIVDVVVKVTAVNDPPSGPPPVLKVTEAGTATGNILDGWSDVEGDLVVIADPGTRTTNQGGSVTIDARGAAVYVAPAGLARSDGFTVRISDGEDTITVAVAVELAAVNQPPVVSNQTFTVSERTPVGRVIGLIGATDPDGDEIEFEVLPPSVVTIDDDGRVILAERLDFEATTSHRVDALAIDEEGAATPFFVAIEVTNIDEAPRINDATFRVEPGAPAGTVVGTIVGTDPERELVTYQLQNANGLVAIDPDSGVITLIKDANPSLFPIIVTVIASDPGGHEGRATVTLLLEDVDAPVITNFAADVDAFYEPPFGGGVCESSPRMATFTARISDSSGVRGADLHWRITVIGVETTGVAKMVPVGGRWTVDLSVPPGILIDGKSATIYSHIRARDDFGHFAESAEIGLTLLPCQRS